ncbi:MAG: hypothetical protein ACC608_01365 [Anaerofustis sp.]|jgi:cation transport ATPase
MKAQSENRDSGKTIAIILLFALSCIIMLSSVGFAVYGMMKGITFTVLHADIPGAVFALVTFYLGFRYFRATQKLMKKLAEEKNSRFSWYNFKKTSKEN